MGKGYLDLDLTSDVIDTEQVETVTTQRQQAAETTEGERLAQSVLHMIEKGEHPATTLYTAIKCIGNLTHNPDWAEQAAGYLDEVYADLMQQSLIEDRAEQERAQLEARQISFYENTKKSLEAQQRKLDRLDVELNKIRLDLTEKIAETERTLEEFTQADA